MFYVRCSPELFTQCLSSIISWDLVSPIYYVSMCHMPLLYYSVSPQTHTPCTSSPTWVSIVIPPWMLWLLWKGCYGPWKGCYARYELSLHLDTCVTAGLLYLVSSSRKAILRHVLHVNLSAGLRKHYTCVAEYCTTIHALFNTFLPAEN